MVKVIFQIILLLQIRRRCIDLIFIFLISPVLIPACNHSPDTMVLIPGGKFKLGLNPSDQLLAFISDQTTYLNAQPMQEVDLPSFYIDRWEVTNGQFKQFKPLSTYEGKINEPIRGVSWYEADAFCIWANKRLPSELEWEKAARGPDGRLFVWGNEFNQSFANFGKIVRRRGAFKKDQSVYGVWDMNGNVSEWTADFYEAYPISKYQDQNFGNKFKVIRGGSFYKRAHGFMKEFVMVTHRNFAPPKIHALDTGFRCARTN